MRHAQPTHVRRAQEKPHEKFIFGREFTDCYPTRGRVWRADGANQKMEVAATQMAVQFADNGGLSSS